ncbi:MAG TPA: amidase, partial [Thermoanaerobaculia bacterium]
MSLPFDAADPALAPDSEEPAAPAAPDLDASDERGFDRRRFLAFAGLGAVALPAVLTAQEKGGIERKALADCETVSGLHFTDAQRDQMLKGLGDLRDSYAAIRKVHIDNGVAPAFHFDPDRPPAGRSGERPPVRMSKPAVDEPPLPQNLATDLEAVAFWPVTRLARLIRERKVTSTALTKMYLARLKRLDPTLHAVITLTEERALASADRADREIAAGRYRGPLHGIPWGAKDLLSAKGYRTTWGSVPFKEQVIDEDATAVARLEEAGAVLIAKLAVGELAWGDVWFGGMTRNPWKPEQGSSGSSAGSA